MSEQLLQENQVSGVDIKSLELDDLLNSFPILNFDEEKRVDARDQLSQNPDMSIPQKVELVLRHGLFEEYSNIEELYKIKTMNLYFEKLSIDEKGNIDSYKLIELKNIYWTNFLYPLISSYILEDDIETVDLLSIKKLDLIGEIIPFARRFRLSSLVEVYKQSSIEEKQKIKDFLKNRLGNYPWKDKSLHKRFE